MIVAEYNGTGDFFGLVHGQSCGVLAISIPVRGFLRVVDASGEDTCIHWGVLTLSRAKMSYSHLLPDGQVRNSHL